VFTNLYVIVKPERNSNPNKSRATLSFRANLVTKDFRSEYHINFWNTFKWIIYSVVFVFVMAVIVFVYLKRFGCTAKPLISPCKKIYEKIKEAKNKKLNEEEEEAKKI